jgi:ABC-2 type transport system permease protein
MGIRRSAAMVRALVRRGVNELVRVPAAAIPGILFPTIFVLGTTAMFGELTALPGFTSDDYLTFVVAVGCLQGAGFTGAATGVNLARDIEQGWFDRLLASPASRPVLLAGTVFSASIRALLPMTFLLLVTVPLGASFPGIDGLLLAAIIVAGFAAVAASWGTTIALRFKTQSAAPLMQAGMLVAVLFTTAYAPEELLQGWLQDVASWNPVTQVVEGVRQGFVADVTWADTWPALLALAGLATALVFTALRGLRHATD